MQQQSTCWEAWDRSATMVMETWNLSSQPVLYRHFMPSAHYKLLASAATCLYNILSPTLP